MANCCWGCYWPADGDPANGAIVIGRVRSVVPELLTQNKLNYSRWPVIDRLEMKLTRTAFQCHFRCHDGEMTVRSQSRSDHLGIDAFGNGHTTAKLAGNESVLVGALLVLCCSKNVYYQPRWNLCKIKRPTNMMQTLFNKIMRLYRGRWCPYRSSWRLLRLVGNERHRQRPKI